MTRRWASGPGWTSSPACRMKGRMSAERQRAGWYGATGQAAAPWCTLMPAMSAETADLRATQQASEPPELDPWSPRGIVHRGVFRGARLDTDHFRSATLLTAEQAARFGSPSDEVLVA